MNVLKKLLAISFFVCAANISKKIQTFAQIGIFFRNVFKSLKIGVGEIQKLKPVIKEYLVLSITDVVTGGSKLSSSGRR